MSDQNKESVEIVFNYTFGGFIIPKEILKYCEISETDDSCGWNLRTNKKLVEIIKKIKNKDKEQIIKILQTDFNINIDDLYEISHLNSLDIKSIPKDVYDMGAISYREYDGLESISINEPMYNVQLARNKLTDLILEINDINTKKKLQEIYDLLPLCKKPYLAW